MPKPLTDKTILYTGEPLFEFPRHIPYVTVSRRRNFEEESSRLFALNNITGAPKTIAGSRGRMVIASGNGREGVVSEAPFSFSFTIASYSGTIVSGNTTLYQDAAAAALSEWSLLPTPYTARLSFVRYFAFSNAEPHPIEQSDPRGALVAEIDMTASVEGYPIFVGDADTPAFSASFDGTNRLIKLRGVIFPNVVKGPKEIAIISYTEALQRLKNGVGVLSSMSLAVKTKEGFMTGEAPSGVAIERASLGYLYSPYQDYLVPIFVFTGKTNLQEERQQVITTTVVSAL